MKYCFLLESLAVKAGGPPRVAAAIANQLVERGHQLTIASVPIDSEAVALSPAVAVEYVSKGAGVRSAFGASRRIRELARQADVIVVSGIWGAIDGLALRLADVESAKLYIRSCGMLEDYILARSPWKKRLARAGYVDRNLGRAASILANTAIEQKYIQEMYPNANVKVVPNGVVLPGVERLDRDSAGCQLGIEIPQGARLLLYLGRIDPKKGLDRLLPQFSRLIQKNPEWHLIVAGAYSDAVYRERIETLARGSDANIHFLGEVSGARKNACFQIADGFVLPSHSEGFPNAVVEALSWQVPAIVTPGCNFPEVAAENAGLQTTLKPEELYQALEDFCLRTDLEQAGKEARRLVENRFTLERVVDQYEELGVR
ncbi:Glycosyl transferase, group 1 family protein [Rhodopirellula islandica]|uniref:Glycosyl transferase, group 1 family protein n=1 Tax=Rhodopirellula islandica TaxID=595434 RepID=A0A0J1B479_RHOIS|nr:glycosyltransferase [Rhodopirellula islandica]KLU01291.1 Glycosyl transferase, group 1 family protein [Rhodopirellula islandica]